MPTAASWAQYTTVVHRPVAGVVHTPGAHTGNPLPNAGTPAVVDR